VGPDDKGKNSTLQSEACFPETLNVIFWTTGCGTERNTYSGIHNQHDITALY
jgi:hypothetical protein